MLKYYLLYWFSPPTLTEERNSWIILAGKNGVSLSQGHSKNLNNQDNCEIEFRAAYTTRDVRISQGNFTSFWPKRVVLHILLTTHGVTVGNAVSLLHRTRGRPHRCIRNSNSNVAQLCVHIHVRRSEPNTNNEIPSPFSLLEGYFMGIY